MYARRNAGGVSRKRCKLASSLYSGTGHPMADDAPRHARKATPRLTQAHTRRVAAHRVVFCGCVLATRSSRPGPRSPQFPKFGHVARTLPPNVRLPSTMQSRLRPYAPIYNKYIDASSTDLHRCTAAPPNQRISETALTARISCYEFFVVHMCTVRVTRVHRYRYVSASA